MKRIKGAQTKLERHVQSWLNDRAKEYESVESVPKDLFYGGCQSGMVSHLIYYVDTIKFYKKYQDEIWNLAIDQSEEFGNKNVFEMLSGLNGSDSLSDTDHVYNLLAWYGFEETARKLSDRNEIEI